MCTAEPRSAKSRSAIFRKRRTGFGDTFVAH